MYSENKAYLLNIFIILIIIYRNVCFGYVKETPPRDVSFSHSEHTFYRNFIVSAPKPCVRSKCIQEKGLYLVKKIRHYKHCQVTDAKPVQVIV